MATMPPVWRDQRRAAAVGELRALSQPLCSTSASRSWRQPLRESSAADHGAGTDRLHGLGPFALSLALRKEKVKDVLPLVAFRCARVPGVGGTRLAGLGLRFPVIVKPAPRTPQSGSQGVGGDREAALHARVLHIFDHYRQPALVEEYIEGREIYVSLAGRSTANLQIFPFFEIDSLLCRRTGPRSCRSRASGWRIR